VKRGAARTGVGADVRSSGGPTTSTVVVEAAGAGLDVVAGAVLEVVELFVVVVVAGAIVVVLVLGVVATAGAGTTTPATVTAAAKASRVRVVFIEGLLGVRSRCRRRAGRRRP
jgi:hypothetical protein